MIQAPTSPDPTLQAAQRVERLREAMDARGLAAAVLIEPANQTYLTGFRALLYSRPIVLVVGRESTALVVPGLEEAHARAAAAVDEVVAYYEHPAGAAPRTHVECLKSVLPPARAGAAVGVESSACPLALGDRLAALGQRLVDVEGQLVRMRQIKDEGERRMIRMAADVTGVGVAASLAAVCGGSTEIDVDRAGTAAVMDAVSSLDAVATVEQLVMTPSGPDRSALPHALSSTRRLQDGDVLIHTRQVGLNGYRAELERTAFVGSSSAERRRALAVARDAQQAAIGAVKAGARCAEVDAAARGIIVAAGYGRHAIHRTGHGIGLSAHEPPYLRFDNEEPLAAGMVITVEPGIYVTGVGGFRHSDTLVVTDDGAEVITGRG